MSTVTHSLQRERLCERVRSSRNRVAPSFLLVIWKETSEAQLERRFGHCEEERGEKALLSIITKFRPC